MNKYQEAKPNCLYMAEETWKQVKAVKTKRIQESITNIDFVKTLENIKNHCSSILCINCKLYKNEKDDCLLTLLAEALCHEPNHWDIEKIKEIVDE